MSRTKRKGIRSSSHPNTHQTTSMTYFTTHRVNICSLNSSLIRKVLHNSYIIQSHTSLPPIPISCVPPYFHLFFYPMYSPAETPIILYLPPYRLHLPSPPASYPNYLS
ncbi:hypothetical protein CLIB1444_17S00826 [[Candida] jaroonii]|uniref:Uncharacterized protein n=1 Tax=[Candida] jaroonii TaxID=467808 RepID=A0ACA9YFY1_9ASCO|nr:hypothetical protein CLIB1444_17S00826 [[Candida] jaroonii]